MWLIFSTSLTSHRALRLLGPSGARFNFSALLPSLWGKGSLATSNTASASGNQGKVGDVLNSRVSSVFWVNH